MIIFCHIIKKISNQLASSNNKFDKKFYKEIISNSLGYLDCTMYKKISAGDHYIILHKVIKCKILSLKPPLIFIIENIILNYLIFLPTPWQNK